MTVMTVTTVRSAPAPCCLHRLRKREIARAVAWACGRRVTKIAGRLTWCDPVLANDAQPEASFRPGEPLSAQELEAYQGLSHMGQSAIQWP